MNMDGVVGTPAKSNSMMEIEEVFVINHRRPAYTILRVLEDARTTPEDSPDPGIR